MVMGFKLAVAHYTRIQRVPAARGVARDPKKSIDSKHLHLNRSCVGETQPQLSALPRVSLTIRPPHQLLGGWHLKSAPSYWEEHHHEDSQSYFECGGRDSHVGAGG